jgi:RNA 2',3'-cyclic 3'-phosphodiesterase
MEPEKFEPASGRLFLSIELPDYVRAGLGRLQHRYGKVDGLAWTPPEKLHITLIFLGEVEEERQRELGRRLSAVQVQPFFVGLEGLGVFPRKGHPRILWAGLEKADPRLFQLHGNVEQLTINLGFEPERRRYAPHVTLARCLPRAEGAVTHILKTEADFGTAPFQVNSFFLYASQLSSEGAIYTRLLEVPWGGS